MRTEIDQLREEIAKLRERIAVLEAAPRYSPQPTPLPYAPPDWTRTPWPQIPIITCGTAYTDQQ